MKLYLQSIVESIQLESLPSEWLNFDFVKFSHKKVLFDYQQQALKNALKALYKYYIDFKQDKKQFFELYQNNGLTENLDFKLNGNKKYKFFEEYDKDYKIENNKIAFYRFINRMNFWMATGSGKTLVVVKLLELLGNLIKSGQIPENDILFLTYREDLIDQFKKHVYEFNNSNNSFQINLYNLKDYEKVKRENRLRWQNEIDAFYYRSDLISDEQKDKIIDFRNYDNDGKWHILLDEAHKGDKEESKRQIYYSILSRNGFLFNFSATFTDAIDFATCVFNFNLEKFIQQGYGKHIFISRANIKELGRQNDFTEKQKQIIILKILLLHTLIRKNKPHKYYHNPLILTLVNSVNTEDSDLFLFFKEIEKVSTGQTDESLLSIAKNELKNDLQGKYEFENEEARFDHSIIDSLTFNDILENVFNTKITGNIEALKIPGNKQEIILKLATSDKPFALIKIGDISEWIKNKLSGYQIIEKFDNESAFKNINKDDSDINILMGSRSFYEGWDSNRPNIILYINIGKGTDARKFVLQSIGRGVRLEPVANKRKRLRFLYNDREIDTNVYNSLKDKIEIIETLFVYGTKADNLKEAIETLKEEKQDELIGDLFQINPEIKDKLILIPVYEESEKILADENYAVKFEINERDLNLAKDFYNYIGDKIALVKFDCKPKILKKINESFNNKEERYIIDANLPFIGKPDIIIKNLIIHGSLKRKDFKEFKPLENEIIHFKQVAITKEKRKDIEEKIKQVLKFKEKEAKIREITEKIRFEPDKAGEYIKEIETITQLYVKEAELDFKTEKVIFRYIQNHYYIPVALSESEKELYFKHIIKTKSEINFLNQLENYLRQQNNFFDQFDWWFFSKIDETLDEVYIPYYQPKTNRIEKFKPDFIFWLQKDNRYAILFVDPKGTEHADGYRKIEGYSKIFEEKFNGSKRRKKFIYNNLEVKVVLLLKSKDIARVLEEYKPYWFDNFSEIARYFDEPYV